MVAKEKIAQLINKSNYISRDLSWLQFNYRVLDQAKKEERTIFERLKFLAITASNLDEFLMVRVGSLYNYLDYNKQRIDFSGLREQPFRDKLFEEIHEFTREQRKYYNQELIPQFAENGFRILKVNDLNPDEKNTIADYFKRTIFPMLTPMVYDNYHPFPILMNKMLVFGVVTKSETSKKRDKKLSFVQIPQNLPRFFTLERDDEIIFVPIEETVREHISKLFRNVEILSINLFRITRDGEFALDEDDSDMNFLEEMKRKLRTRRTGRVVRLEVEKTCSKWMLKTLVERWNLTEDNVFAYTSLLDFTGLMEIAFHKEFLHTLPRIPDNIPPIGFETDKFEDIFQEIKRRDILLHHPYHSFEPVLQLLEQSADDPNVLAIKITIYRLAKDSRVTAALLRAAENGKHVSVLFEVKARFDEENNILEANKLQRAGCFVIYGVSNLKTHTKLMLVVRKEEDRVRRYVHMSTGNYNESTAKLYTDLGLLSTSEEYADDVSEFFNVITGHSQLHNYNLLLTAPENMRSGMLALIQTEIKNAQKGLPSGIVFKVNSLQDTKLIDALYEASQAGVPVKLIVRGICSLRPGRKGLSENIEVYSMVGNFLEHSRIYYFHSNGEPKIFSGSADAMVRSFDRRIESLFLLTDEDCRKQAVTILQYNLKDNYNTYQMQEDASYEPVPLDGNPLFDSHKAFFELFEEQLDSELLFAPSEVTQEEVLEIL